MFQHLSPLTFFFLVTSIHLRLFGCRGCCSLGVFVDLRCPSTPEPHTHRTHTRLTVFVHIVAGGGARPSCTTTSCSVASSSLSTSAMQSRSKQGTSARPSTSPSLQSAAVHSSNSRTSSPHGSNYGGPTLFTSTMRWGTLTAAVAHRRSCTLPVVIHWPLRFSFFFSSFFLMLLRAVLW